MIRRFATIPTMALLVLTSTGCGADLSKWRPVPKGSAAAREAQATSQPCPTTQASGGALTRMLLDRPIVPLTTPRGTPAQPRPVAPAQENRQVIDRRCSLKKNKQTGWYLLTFERDSSLPYEPPRWVLPSWYLQRMEEHLAERGELTVFRVSGTTTVYDARAFILLHKVTVVTRLPAEDQDVALVKPAAEQEPLKSPAGTATSAPALNEDDDLLAPSELAARLLRDKTGEPVLRPQRAPEVSAEARRSVAPAGDKPLLPPGRGNFVTDRLVRVLPVGVGKWMKVSFESDNTLQEPPIRLLPCRLLHEAEQLAKEKRFEKLRFRVSGEITQYKGRRYLLLRKLMPEREMGQF